MCSGVAINTQTPPPSDATGDVVDVALSKMLHTFSRLCILIDDNTKLELLDIVMKGLNKIMTGRFVPYHLRVFVRIVDSMTTENITCKR